MRTIEETTELEKRIIFEACKCVLNDYNINTIQKRIDEDKWTEISIFSDLFQLVRLPDKPEYNGQMMKTFCCNIPNQRVFYDILLGLYVLWKPDVYRNTQVAAQMLLRTLLYACEQTNLDWRHFENFNVENYTYLQQCASGDPDFCSLFNNQPFEALRMAHYICKEVAIQEKDVTAEMRAVFEENYSKTSDGLKLREKEFQDRCLRASAPTSP